MARKTDEERLAELKQKREALLADERKIRSRVAKKERNARTKRLIEIGATIEAALGYEVTAEMLPQLSNFIKQQEERGKFVSHALGIPVQETPDNHEDGF